MRNVNTVGAQVLRIVHDHKHGIMYIARDARAAIPGDAEPGRFHTLPLRFLDCGRSRFSQVRRYRRVMVAMALAAICLLADAHIAGACEPAPPQSKLEQAIMPTPIDDDPFFSPVPNLCAYEPGQIITWRKIKTLYTRFLVYQFKVRSNDANDYPVAVTATLFVPKVPWSKGQRPVVVNNQAIDSLGTRCTPSYNYARYGFTIEEPQITDVMLHKGYAVLVPDHEGPMMAYAEGTMAAHAILDSVRGLKRFTQTNLAQSPLAMVGYSGGAIATGWAAQLQPYYAPELSFVGAIAGGTPTDFNLLEKTMNHTIGGGLYKAGILGIARQHPELLNVANAAGVLLAISPLKDACVGLLAPAGLIYLPIEWLANQPNPFDTPQAREVLDGTRMGKLKPEMPVYLFHGSIDEWIPEQGAIQVWHDWCSLGANVSFTAVPGDHIIGMFTGLGGFIKWLEERFAGIPAPNGCPCQSQKP
ncbi:MAG TPA: lipase family protein [Syntrophorhabdaceae bacterium]|nr:lipase family protein [Syntrophorhabdaceae bacterium]HPA07246.1 lipase family protein [Methanoregulaceae archaeon]